MTPDGIVTVLHEFGAGTDGASPLAGLIQATDGNLYGTTLIGGDGHGTVYKMSPDGTVTVLHAFAVTDGFLPGSALIQATDGNFYGTTLRGGASGEGTVFKMTPDGTVTVLRAFGPGPDGAFPSAALIQATDWSFYGTTLGGGAFHRGTVFRMAADGVVTILHEFRGEADGSTPSAALIRATDGYLYGTTLQGGATGHGTVFKMSPAGALIVLHAFTGTDGDGPLAALVQATDGNFYGTTRTGGPSKTSGVVFRMINIPCDDTLSLSYTLGTLNLGFTLMSSVPAVWSSWLAFQSDVVELWSVSIPAVSPAVSFSVPIPGFPMTGNVGVLTTLSTADFGIICADWKTVDTGGGSPTGHDLKPK